MSKLVENKGQLQGDTGTSPSTGAEDRRQVIIDIIVHHFLSCLLYTSDAADE